MPKYIMHLIDGIDVTLDRDGVEISVRSNRGGRIAVRTRLHGR